MPVALLFNGWVVDKLQEQKAFLIGLAGHIIWNIVFAAICYYYQGTTFLTVCAFIYYPVTCYFQSFSEIVINKNNALWYDKDERGIIAGVFTLCLAIGYLLGFAGNSVIVEVTQSAAVLFLTCSVLLSLSFFSVAFCLTEDHKDILAAEEKMRLAGKISVIEEGIQGEEAKKQVEEKFAEQAKKRQENQAPTSPIVNATVIPQEQQQEHKAVISQTGEETIGNIKVFVGDVGSDGVHHPTKQQIEEEDQRQDDIAHGAKPAATLISNPEELQTWRDVVFTIDFLLICLCFCIIGLIRDGFFVWLNQYLQYRFNLKIGSVFQLLTFSSLTIGSALSAFVSAAFNSIFKDNNFSNGFVCFGLATLFYLIFGASTNIWVTILATGSATTMILAVLGIRRILSMTLGGYGMTGMITGILGAATFLGGGIGSIFSQIIISYMGYIVWGYSLCLVSVMGAVLFIVGAIRAREFHHIHLFRPFQSKHHYELVSGREH